MYFFLRQAIWLLQISLALCISTVSDIIVELTY